MRSNPGTTYLGGKEIVKDTKKCVEIDVDNAAWFVQKMDDTKTKFSSYVSLDPKCDKLPDWLLNNLCKMLATVFMK